MGLGKTLEALALMCHTKERGLTDAPYLVVAPTSVVGNWASECHRFAPALEVVTVTETGEAPGEPAGRPGSAGRTWSSPRTACSGWSTTATPR